jgi:hypothetical protein
MPNFAKLPRTAQRLLIARCVNFAKEFLSKGESYFPGSKKLDDFRATFGERLESFSQDLAAGEEQADRVGILLADLEGALDETNAIPVGEDKLDPHAQNCILVIAAACDWAMGSSTACNVVAEHLLNFLDEVGGQANLATAGRVSMREDEINVAEWVKPEEEWQQRFHDRAQELKNDELMSMMADGGRRYIEAMIPKANAAIVASRKLRDL